VSIVFDARKRAEQSKRAREAVAGISQLSDREPHSSESSDAALPDHESCLEPQPDEQRRQVRIPPAPSTHSEAPSNTLLGLRVERRTNDWRVRWNRNAAPDAGCGRLSITDGEIQRQLELGINELRNGSIVYSPVTDDVVLRLEITSPEAPSPISESVRLVASALPTHRTGAARIARSHAAWTPDTTEGAVAQESAIVRSLLRTPHWEPFSGASRAAGLAQQGSKIEPATLIWRRNPVYPAIAQQSLASESVEVHFRISPEGKVYNAKSVKGSPILAQAAIEAVKVWCYEPARLNGAPIDSQGSTTFDFEPN
jgi:TonB family protein